MPRLRKNAQERRAESLRLAIERGKINKGMKQIDLAQSIGMSNQSFSHYKRYNFENMRLCDFGEMVRSLEFTPRELCDIFGVVYIEPNAGR